MFANITQEVFCKCKHNTCITHVIDWGFVMTKTDKEECMLILRIKTTQLLNVPGVGEDLAVDGFQPVGAWAKYFCDDVGSFPGRGEFVAVLVALHKMEDEVSDVEGVTEPTKS